MTKQNKVTSYEKDKDITCPVCGSNNWKLFKMKQTDYEKQGCCDKGFKIPYSNQCYVDDIDGSTNSKIYKKRASFGEEQRDSGYIGWFRAACSNGCYVCNANVYERDSKIGVVKEALDIIHKEDEIWPPDLKRYIHPEQKKAFAEYMDLYRKNVKR